MYKYKEMPGILKTPKYRPDVGSFDYPDYSKDEIFLPDWYKHRVDAPYYKDTYYSDQSFFNKRPGIFKD